jgi:hypothetical protein
MSIKNILHYLISEKIFKNYDAIQNNLDIKDSIRALFENNLSNNM